MKTVSLTRHQARRFVVQHQGLSGPYRYLGRQGIIAYVQHVGCLQYDPIDAVGRNIDLVLFSRVDALERSDLEGCLYEDRTLIDHWDKVMSVCLMDDWPKLRQLRQSIGTRHLDALDNHEAVTFVKQALREHGPLTAADLPEMGTSTQTWRTQKISQAALDALFFIGAAVIAKRIGIKRIFDDAEARIPKHLYTQPDPFDDADQFQRWRIKRRIGALGLLWGRRSDAFLGIEALPSKAIQQHMHALIESKDVMQVDVEGLAEPLYMLTSARADLECVLANEKASPRLELLAPLDNFLWDRRLTHALFDFKYVWEVYTPASKRQYGYYVLPILYGDIIVGRIDVRAVRKMNTLSVFNLWLEKPVDADFSEKLTATLERLRRYLKLDTCVWHVQKP